ncbi:B12-binding domain-containing radical SAM protein [Streptomyces sp. NPDC050560]|uniref:B12-binding domain-containing radical SAM protein n=1 Tax=Streptomyces sp. NPDC050560 TaxID=3365630 RepID=UPI003795F928
MCIVHIARTYRPGGNPMVQQIELRTPGKRRDVWKKPSDFRVLLVYPNIQQAAMMPYSMGLFTAILRDQGFQVDLFDSSFYVEELTSNYVHYRTFTKQFDWLERDVRFRESNMLDDFRAKVARFQPDLIAVSVVENTYSIGRAMMRALPAQDRKIPTIWGGPFATFAPNFILRDNVGDFVCRGEGEIALVELCQRMCDGRPLTDIPNLWVRSDGQLYRNPLGERVDLDQLPFADYSLFEEQAIYRPMEGRLWRTIGIESQRGCPYQCTYCNSPGNNRMAVAEQGSKFYRRKSLDRVMAELDHLNKRHDIELVYWLADTFLAVPNKYFDELVERYEDYRIPFWMNTRSETMTEHAADGLERMNMLRTSIGVEHGNAEYRRKMLKRFQTNDQLRRAFEVCSGRSFSTTGNLIIGMPEETRELIFETIDFTRSLPDDIDTVGCFIFSPLHGTELRRIAESNGYLDPETFCDISDPEVSILDQPQLSRAEVIGIAKCFGLYQTAPKEDWDRVRAAEPETPEANAKLEELVRHYRPGDAVAMAD